MQSELENKLLNPDKEELLSFVEKYPQSFHKLVEYAVSDEEPFNWRSAWVIFHSIKRNDKRLTEEIDRLVDAVSNKNDGHQRELIKILNKMDLNEDQEGKLFNISMNIWEQLGKSPSVRSTAIQFIAKMAKKYPELRSELDFLTQEQYLETLSPGIKHSIKRLIQQIK